MQLPKAWLYQAQTQAQTQTNKHTAAVEAKSKVTAKIDMSADVLGKGLCPDCRRPMARAFAADHEVYVCDSDRIALPVRD